MNLHKYPKIYSSLITLGVFVLLMTPSLVLAQSDGVGEGGITNFIQEQVWKFLTMVGGFLVWLGGKMLNYAVTYYVVGFGDFYLSSGLGDSVNSLWSIVRDVFNLTFIFGLVFIGFKLIFGDGSAKRALGTLIMAALLVNFSLFITKFVIDFSNIAAAQFANAFLVGTQYDVSDGFMRLFGLNGIFSTGNDLPSTAGWTYIFLTFLLFIVSAFVFIAGGLLLIIRFVVLNIYMILSPVMFLGWVFPGFSGTSRSYWSGFLKRAFFAPAYLLMLYMSHQVLVNMRLSNGSSQKLGAVATNDANAANAAFDQTIPLFLVSIIFLIASLIVAQKMGAQGATSAIAIGKRLTGRAKQAATRVAGGATAGTAAWAGRNSLGWAANSLSQNNTLNKFAAKSLVGKKALEATRGVANSSFDARNVGGIGKKYGLGTGSTGGYAGAMKKKGDDAVKFADSLNKGKVELDEFGKYKDKKQGAAIEAAIDKARNDDKTVYGFYSTQSKTKSQNLQGQRGASQLLATERGNLTNELVNLEQQRKALLMDDNTTEEEKAAVQEMINSKTAELKSKEDAIKVSKEEERKLELEVKNLNTKAEKAERELRESEESKIIYANQLAYIERREKDSKFWTPGAGGVLGGSTALGGLAAAAGLGATGIGAGIAIGAPLVSAHKRGHDAAVEALRKKYGKDGTPEQKAKKKKDELKLLKEELDADKDNNKKSDDEK
jgi:hypothetical protein